MGNHIDNVVPSGSENKLYNCECKIFDEGPAYVDWVGFRLSGQQMRDIWNGIGRMASHDFDIEFQFLYPDSKLPLVILSRDKYRVDRYLGAVGAEPIFSKV